MRLNLDNDEYAALARELAPLLLDELRRGLAQPTSPWMQTEEAIAYSQIPEGTFRQWAANGTIPSHGGRRKLFHRAEVDEAIFRYPGR